MREKKTFCYRGERERRGWGVRMPDKEICKNDMEALFYGVKLLNFSGLSLVLKKEKACDCIRHSPSVNSPEKLTAQIQLTCLDVVRNVQNPPVPVYLCESQL